MDTTNYYKLSIEKETVAKFRIMNALLVNPIYYKLFGSHNNRANIGLCTISKLLQSKGYKSAILNLDSSNKKHLISRSKILENSQLIKKSLLSSAKKRLKEQIIRLKPDHLIFSIGDITNPSVDLASFDITEQLSIYIKNHFPKIFISAIGPFVEKSPNFDMILFGNPEQYILNYLQQRKPGFHKVKVTNKTLERLPFAEIEDNINKIKATDFDYIWQSRGCSYNCSFCVNPIISNKKVQYRSPKRFVDEIEFRYKKYKIYDFYFTDPTFNHNSKNLEKVCYEITKRKLPISYRCECRIDLLNNTQIKLLQHSGCSHVKLGIEAMNNKRLKFLGKGFSINEVQKKIELLKKKNLKYVVYIMLGHPNYNYQDYLKEYHKFKALKANQYTVSILNPFYNSQLKKDDTFLSFPKQLSSCHLNFHATQYWKLNPDIIRLFYNLELSKGREDSLIRTFIN